MTKILQGKLDSTSVQGPGMPGLRFCALLLLVVTLSFGALAQSSGGSYQITNSAVAGGGGDSSDGTSNGLAHQSTIGEHTAGALLRNPPYSVTGGFWAAGIGLTPTAAPGSISGQVTSSSGTPLAGVVMILSGARSARTITDVHGLYSFSEAEIGGFYTITPLRVNYSFNPTVRTFSLLANKTDAVFTAVANPGETANPLDTPEFFVRQQYVDFLDREPDSTGFDYWTSSIRQCGAGAACQHARRLDVSNAFFFEQEFQESGAFVYRVYQAALGQPPAFARFQQDRSLVRGGANLDQDKSAFALAFVQRAGFVQTYPQAQMADQFVDALLSAIAQNSGVDLGSQRNALIGLYDGTDAGRAAILRELADSRAFIDAEYNRAFVLTQYFGYLRRDPDRDGFDFWLNQVNRFPIRTVQIQHAMVCSFITSAEYQQWFSSIVTHSNAECAR